MCVYVYVHSCERLRVCLGVGVGAHAGAHTCMQESALATHLVKMAHALLDSLICVCAIACVACVCVCVCKCVCVRVCVCVCMCMCVCCGFSPLTG